MAHFRFEGGTLVLIASVPGHSLSFPVTPHNQYLIPPVARVTTNYPLRDQHNIVTLFSRTELFRKSSVRSLIAMWNSLDDNLRNSPSFNSFKYNLKKDSSSAKVPIYYTYGDRYLSMKHKRI